MFKIWKPAGFAAALAVGAMAFGTTAEAREHYRGHGGDEAALAIGAGIIGLAVGAAIASNSDRGYYDDGYYGGYYYGRPYYYPAYPRGYYYDHYPRRGYYHDHRGGGHWDRGRNFHRHHGW